MYIKVLNEFVDVNLDKVGDKGIDLSKFGLNKKLRV